MTRKHRPQQRNASGTVYVGEPVPLPDGSALWLRPGKLHWYLVIPNGDEAVKARLRQYLAGHPLWDERSAGFLTADDARATAEDFAAAEAAQMVDRSTICDFGAPAGGTAA